MTQEEKQLLLKDLCGRLPYKICARQYYSAFEDDFLIEGIIGEEIYAAYNLRISMTYPVEKIKPYLRPMSSMTEDEKEYIKNRWCYSDWDIAGPSSLWREKIDVEDAVWIIDYFNKHHFDYRGLILKGLALKAPEEMYTV